MTEDPRIIELYIRHYRELLKLDRHTPETRQRVLGLLAKAEAELADAAASQPNREETFPAVAPGDTG